MIVTYEETVGYGQLQNAIKAARDHGQQIVDVMVGERRISGGAAHALTVIGLGPAPLDQPPVGRRHLEELSRAGLLRKVEGGQEVAPDMSVMLSSCLLVQQTQR
jgi:hypothetical protein